MPYLRTSGLCQAVSPGKKTCGQAMSFSLVNVRTFSRV